LEFGDRHEDSLSHARQARSGRKRIARQTALIEELEEQGHTALALAARGILMSLKKSQEPMEESLPKTRSVKTKARRTRRSKLI